MYKLIDNLKCPNCGSSLCLMNKAFKCDNNHCFDVAKEGYVNLLLPNQKKSKDPGDDKLMIDARNKFLNKGYYEELKHEIHNFLNKYKHRFILDAGCGTGYYTKGIEESKVVGVDISKNAIQIASKSNKENTYIVASIFSLPLKNQSVDVVLSVFAPKPAEEFKRVLKPNGVIVEVIPGKNHLRELKGVIYQEEYKQNKEKISFPDFEIIESKRLEYKKQITEKEDALNLLKMTPYWYKGGEKNLLRLDEICLNEVMFDFIINIYALKS